jgi:hypothetical protein
MIEATEKQSVKQPWQRPTLTTLGDLETLTAGGGGGDPDGAGLS